MNLTDEELVEIIRRVTFLNLPEIIQEVYKRGYEKAVIDMLCVEKTGVGFL